MAPKKNKNEEPETPEETFEREEAFVEPVARPTTFVDKDDDPLFTPVDVPPSPFRTEPERIEAERAANKTARDEAERIANKRNRDEEALEKANEPFVIPPDLPPAREIKLLEERIEVLKKRLDAVLHPFVEFPKMVKDRTFNTREEQDKAGPDYADVE